ncbi:MAG TPA: peptide-methionine (S)-S-oxide reductase MsrA [Chloroflexota bacterium]|nr:peptide-methionine (S)-S-oxide reductase MsrA [Chloroflexota bacterium]
MAQLEKATLGGGCFWCLEAVYQDVEGVDQVVSGYAGGHVPHPSYKAVCTGTTGHAEVIQISFDPDVISYEELLDIFWHIHDPTTPNRQGNDVGSQYRSIILTHNEAQQQIAAQSLAATDASDLYAQPIVTEIVSLDTFYPAEDYHQNYFNENPYQPYCMVVVNPKVQKFRKSFKAKLKAGVQE